MDRLAVRVHPCAKLKLPCSFSISVYYYTIMSKKNQAFYIYFWVMGKMDCTETEREGGGRKGQTKR